MASIPEDRLNNLNAHWNAANYLAAAMLYLKENSLLENELTADQIKPRLLGHWGTVPALNLIYSHLNRLIQDTDAEVLYIPGTGHGAPAIDANQYIEGSLGEHLPEYSHGLEGITNLTRDFSWPGGLPSHVSPHNPGTIQEGGELGYALSHAYGAAFDNPDLIVVAAIGDGEAETGPTATAWHSNKYLNPKTDGAVLPILNLNEYKIAGPTVFGRMSHEELENLFIGYGYDVYFVEGDEPLRVHKTFWQTLDTVYQKIRNIQKQARDENVVDAPHWPMIILHTPKGWTGPKVVDGKPVEGTFRAHQVPVKEAKNNPEHLKELTAWLSSYEPANLFNADGTPADTVNALLPREDKMLGNSPYTNGGRRLKPLKLPNFQDYAVDIETPGDIHLRATRRLGKMLRDLYQNSQEDKNFRLFCPDETESNRLDDVFEVTDRCFTWPLTDKDVNISPDGRVMEVLSEHQCEGWLEGYLLTGHHGLFACYEAFITIVDSMATQYAKWVQRSDETAWREPIASLNYLLTSHSWRQDHNGFTHQGPGFINTLLTKPGDVARIYLPPDANSLLSVSDHILRSKNYINLVISSKQVMPQWQTMDEAIEQAKKGLAIWDWAGHNDDGDPDVVLAAAGDVPTQEVVAAAWLLRREAPDLKVRVINVVDLLSLANPSSHPHGISHNEFVDIFTPDTPVIFSFHGYPSAIHELIYDRPNEDNFEVLGYQERGTTTTPFDMTVYNGISRYQLVMEVAECPPLQDRKAEIIEKYQKKIDKHRTYIHEHGRDMPEIRDWKWSNRP